MLHPAFRSIFAAAALLLLAACGAPAAQPVASPSPSPEGSSAADMAATRIISHAMGETEVPANPQRVVVLDTGELDSVLALGVKPVGAVEALPGMGYQAYFGDRTDGITNVGTIAEPNLETIVGLKPDLIISNKVRHEDIYEQLAQIAPTVFGERVGVVWKENFKLHADALGKAAEAVRIEAAYRSRVEQLRQRLGHPGSISVSVTRFLEGQVRQYQRGSFIGTILEDVGVARPEQQQLPDETWTEVNRELIPQLDADVMFVTHYGPAEKTPKSEFQGDPLWAQLAVVQHDRVYEVSDDHWMLGLGYLAADRVLDDLEHYLAEVSTTSAATPEATEQAGGTRTITHALGTIEVTGVPQRVVALEWTYVEDLLALGIQPVGVADVAGYSDWVRTPVELDPGVQDVGTRQEPNLEAIAQLKPDLIITAAFRAANNFDQLSAIAPTIAFDPYPTDDMTQYDEMRATFMTIAELLDRAAQGQAVLEAMDAALADAKARLTEAGHGGETFVLAQAFSANDAASIRLFTDNALATQVVEQIGLQNAWEDAPQQYGFSTVGLEGLAQLGDTNFFYVVPDDDNVFEAAAAAPVWNSLRFVQTGRAYPLGSDTWLFGGPLSMELLVEKVTNALLEE